MSFKLASYLNFPGTSREAMAFYQGIFGGEVRIWTFGEFGVFPEGHELSEGVMHASLEGGAIELYAADAIEGMAPYQPGTNVTLSLMGDDAERLSGYFEALSDGAQIEMPLAPQVWGDTYGALTDRYGVHWMVNIAAAE